MNNFKYILSLFLFLFTGLLFSCSEDSDVPDRGQEDDLCPVVIQIGSSESSQTRAFLANDFEDHEYIHSLCVFLVNAETNLIEEKWMLEDGTSEPGGTETEKAGNITKWTSPEVLVSAGPKIIYAFANWETAQNETWNEIISRKENATLTQEELNNIVLDDPASKINFGEERYIPKRYIPMSLSHSFTLSASTGSIEVWLVRLVSRIDVTVTNNSDEDVTLSGFSMSDFATKVRLMEGSSATITGNHISYSEDNASIFLEKLTGKKEFSFYVNETLDEQPYSIKIGEYTGTITEQKPFPRNNYWQINLYINTSDLVIEAYIAPIGVYPFIAATRGDILDKNGNNLEVTLPEGCRFHVRTQDGDPCELDFPGGTTSSDIIVLENETGWAHLTAVEGQSVTIRVNNKYDLTITTDGLENYESSMMRAPIGWDIYSWSIPIHLSRPECNEGHK